MTKVVNIDAVYRRFIGAKAIDKFFKTHSELDYWKETFEYMLENGVDFFCDNEFADGTPNPDWTYALHLDVDEDFTYIAVIERAGYKIADC